MNRLQCLIRLARALDYNRDPDPEHWKTINGAKVHLDKNGNYDGGAGGKFTGRHHYGPGWKQKTALMNKLTSALRSGVTQKQAQGNQAGNSPSQNVASKATSNGGGNGTIKTEKEYEIEISNIKQDYDKVLHDPNATIADKQAAFAKVKAVCVEAAQNGHVIVGKHLQNSVATPEQIDDIKTHLKNAPMEIRALWNMHGSEINQDLDFSKLTPKEKKWPKYSSGRQMIHMDLNREIRDGGVEEAYKTYFHENGHAIDAQIALKASGKIPRNYVACLYAAQYNNGEFVKAIESDVKKIISSAEKEIKDRITQGDYEWLFDHALFDSVEQFYNGRMNPQTQRWEMTQMPPNFKYKKALTYKLIEVNLRRLARKEGSYVCTDLADMLNGATNGKIKAVGFHENKYWKSQRNWYQAVYGEDLNYGLAVEAFAEFVSAKTVNPGSVNVLKKFLPTASDCIDRMLKDAIK